MNKAIIFDLDGVLVDSKEIHFNALNLALNDVHPRYVITQKEQETTYEGLTTRSKLDILSYTKGLPQSFHEMVWKNKQSYSSAMFESIGQDNELIELFSLIKSNNIKIGVASNAIRQTVDACLNSLGIAELVDFSLSNEDVDSPKPNPEIYLSMMTLLKSDQSTTVIFEDSDVGQTAAKNSGANLIPVVNRSSINLSTITEALDILSTQKDVNIVIPMAGNGSRFYDAGYPQPKPLIDIDGKPMIARVVESIGINGNYIFIVQRSHYNQYALQELLESIAPGCTIIQLDEKTSGAAVTTLMAKDLINNNKPLIIANSDQIVEWDNKLFYSMLISKNSHGVISLFPSDNPKWSYAKIEHGLVSQVAEKEVISNEATVGIYGWRFGSDYVKYAEQMILKEIRTNNEFYVCPVYNEAIGDGKRIMPFYVNKMWGVGTPEDLEEYFAKNRT